MIAVTHRVSVADGVTLPRDFGATAITAPSAANEIRKRTTPDALRAACSASAHALKPMRFSASIRNTTVCASSVCCRRRDGSTISHLRSLQVAFVHQSSPAKTVLRPHVEATSSNRSPPLPKAAHFLFTALQGSTSFRSIRRAMQSDVRSHTRANSISCLHFAEALPHTSVAVSRRSSGPPSDAAEAIGRNSRSMIRWSICILRHIAREGHPK